MVPTKLLDESVEPAFVQHLVDLEPVRKQTRGLGFQEQAFNGDVAFRNVRRHDEEGETIDAPLNPTVGLFAWNHIVP